MSRTDDTQRGGAACSRSSQRAARREQNCCHTRRSSAACAQSPLSQSATARAAGRHPRALDLERARSWNCHERAEPTPIPPHCPSRQPGDDHARQDAVTAKRRGPPAWRSRETTAMASGRHRDYADAAGAAPDPARVCPLCRGRQGAAAGCAGGTSSLRTAHARAKARESEW
jgi:hypothetical protein